MDTNNNAIPPTVEPIQPSDIPVQPTPNVEQQPINSQINVPPMPRKNKKLLLLIIALIGALLILFSSLTVIYAYEVIPAGNKATQEAVSHFVQGLPFMPKTLPYVMKSSIQAHEKVTKFTLDASVAGSSESSISLLGTSNFDMAITGPIDYTDLNNPMASINAKITKDFDFDFVGKGYISYFRVNKIPATISALLTAFLGIDEKQILNKWFYYDETPLQTDARTALDAQKKNENDSEKIVGELFTTLKDPEVAKVTTMKNESFGDLPMYHIHFAPNDQVLDMFWKKYKKNVYPESTDSSSLSDSKISQTVTNFVLDVWIDRKTYLVRKSITTFTLKGSSSSYDTTPSALSLVPTQNSDVDISMVVNLTDYGKDAEFTSPTGAIEFGEYLKSLTPTIASRSASMYGSSYADQLGQSNDTKRKSDVTTILNAIGQYAASNNGQFPPEIAKLSVGSKIEINSYNFPNLCRQLVTDFMPFIPVDPSGNDQYGVEFGDCVKPWTTSGYMISKDALNRITISATAEALNAKPIEVTR